MSVTFSPMLTEDEIEAVLSHGAAWPEFPLELDVNMSNVNARYVLASLGLAHDDGSRDPFLAEDLSGDAGASEFLGAILLALGMAPADEGVPAHSLQPDRSPTESQLIDCGRRPGYLQERLLELHRLAEWCVDNDRRVQWA